MSKDLTVAAAPLTIQGISSMATRLVLAELTQVFEQQSATKVLMESVGGVDAAKRVQAGEAFDVVILASDAIDRLVASGHLHAGSRVDLMRSGVAVAVAADAPLPGSAPAPAAAAGSVPAAAASGAPSGPSPSA